MEVRGQSWGVGSLLYVGSWNPPQVSRLDGKHLCHLWFCPPSLSFLCPPLFLSYTVSDGSGWPRTRFVTKGNCSLSHLCLQNARISDRSQHKLNTLSMADRASPSFILILKVVIPVATRKIPTLTTPHPSCKQKSKGQRNQVSRRGRPIPSL